MSKSSVSKLFKSNKLAMVFSVFIAIVLWATITIFEAPHKEKTIADVAVTVPIDTSLAHEAGLDIVGKNFDPKASVTIKGSNYIIGTITADDISLSLSLTDVTAPGIYDLEVKAAKRTTAVSPEYDIISISPSEIKVRFDFIETKDFEVSVKTIGASAIEGLVAEPAILSDTSFSTLTVKGPKSDMQRIESVEAVMEVNKVLDKTTSFDADIQLLDEKGGVIDKSPFTITTAEQTEVTKLSISVPISKTKEVDVRVAFINDPGGFASNPLPLTLSFQKVKIIGPPESIDLIKEVFLSPIDFYNVSPSKNIFQCGLTLPDGVKTVDRIEQVTITLDLTGYITRTFTVSHLLVSPSSANVTLNSNMQNVQVCGPRSVVNNLSAGDLVALIDVSAKPAGQHTLDAKIKANTNNRVWQVGAYTASVTIK